jgi:hypothetical protein
MLKKGPQIKMPELKVPDFVLDIYYDLRERHLLPLVALLVLAVIAVPIVLTESSGDPSELETGLGTSSSIPSKETSEIVVAKNAPGLRDYRRRLEHREARDPFKQQFSGPAGDTSSGGREGGSSEGESETGGGAAPLPEPPSEDDGAPTSNLRYFSYALDVRVVPVATRGKPSKAEPSVRRRLPELTMLPSRDTPALVFMGVTKDTKKAVMLVSSGVTALFGDGICVVGAETCELLALEPGVPETVVYGANRRTFRIEVLKLELLETDRLNKAPLGDPKKKQQDG